MTITINLDSTGVTLDESGALQDGNDTLPAAGEDNVDQDVLLSDLQSNASDFYNRLFVDLALDDTFALANGVAHGDIAAVSTSGTPITDVLFSFTDGDPSGLFDLDGNQLFLYVDPTNSDIVFLRRGSDASTADEFGDIVAAVYLDSDDDGVSTTADVDAWIVQFEAMLGPSAGDVLATDADELDALTGLSLTVNSSIDFDFAVLNATKFLFGVVGDADGGFMVIGKEPNIDSDGEPVKGKDAGDLINTSKGGGETTIGVRNQHFTGDDITTTAEQGAYFTYITGMAGGTYKDADDFTGVGLIPSTTAALQVSQTQAEGTVSPGMQISTFNTTFINGQDFVNNQLGDPTKTVDILTIKIYEDTLTDTPDVFDVDSMLTGEANSVTIGAYTVTKIDADTVRIDGLTDDDWVEWTTDGTHTQVLVEATSGKWDIGNFDILEAETETVAIDNIFFEDDFPIAALNDIGGTVTVDETSGLQDDPGASDTGVGADPDNDDVAGSAMFDPNGTGSDTLANWFDITNEGTDSGMSTQYAVSSSPLVDTVGTDAGTDGEKSAVISLAISSFAVNGDSGLTTTDGTPIKLFEETHNGVDMIVGRYDDDVLNPTISDVDGGDPAAFAIMIDQNGDVAVAQFVSLTNPTSPNDFDEGIDLASNSINRIDAVLTVIDNDDDVSTDSREIGDQIIFEDDGPAAMINTGGTVTIDESAGLQDAPGATDTGAGADPDNDDVAGSTMFDPNGSGAVMLSALFNITNEGSDSGMVTQYALSASAVVTSTGSSAGADDEGATTVFSLAINASVTDGDSGLTTTDGTPIKLFEETHNGVDMIVGRYDDDELNPTISDVDSGDPAAFAISIDQSGNIAVAQYVSLANPTSPSNFDEPVDLTGKVDGVVTVTDGDGDKDTASTDVGDQINFEDDGPTAMINAGGTVTIDETAGLQDGTFVEPAGLDEDDNDDDVVGTTQFDPDGSGNDDLANWFDISNEGSDTGFPQYALSASAVVTSAGSSAGADDEGATTVFSLLVANSVSGLQTTEGWDIVLFEETHNGAEMIVGRYDVNNDEAVTGTSPAAFAIMIDQSGNVAVAQYVSLDNPVTTDDDDPVDLTGKIDAVVTVTDGDGDKDTASTGVGDQIIFEDDGPVAAISGSGSVTIDETAGLQDGTFVEPAGLDEDDNDDDVVGTTAFDPDGAGGNAPTTLAALFNISNEGSDTGFPQYALSSSAVVSTAVSSAGADDEGATTVLSLEVANSTSGLQTTDGWDIVLFEETHNGVDLIVGRYDVNNDEAVTNSSPAAFAISIDQSGNIAVAQYVSLDNPDDMDDDDPVDLTGKINAVVTVTDGDGDEDTASTDVGDQIIFEDDGPVAAINAGGSVTIDESPGIQTGGDSPTASEDDDDDDVAGSSMFDPNGTGAVMLSALFNITNEGSDTNLPQYALSSSAVVTTTGSSAGADDEGATTVLSLEVNNSVSGLQTTEGWDIVLFEETHNGVDMIVGRYDVDNDEAVSNSSPAAFAISIDQSGNIAVAQYVSLDNQDDMDDDEAVDLTGKINAVVTVTDGDGDKDTASTDIGDQINFEDDFPVLADPANSVVDFVLSDGDFTDTVGGADGDIKVNFAFDPGSDNEGATLAFTDYTDPDNATDVANSNLDALEAILGDISIDVAQTNDTTIVYETADGTDLFRITLDPNDPENYTFEVLQEAPLVFTPLNLSTFISGDPQELIEVFSAGGTQVTFDGLLFDGSNANRDTILMSEIDNRPNDGIDDNFEKQDDINVSNLGGGLVQGQSSSLNDHQGFTMMFDNPVFGTDYNLRIQGQGQMDPFTISILVFDASTSTFEQTHFDVTQDILDSLSGNDNFNLTIAIDDLGLNPEVELTTVDQIDQIWFKYTYDDPSDSVRFKDVFILERDPVPDVELAFEVQGTDGDGDPTDTQTFTVGVDGDGDGISI